MSSETCNVISLYLHVCTVPQIIIQRYQVEKSAKVSKTAVQAGFQSRPGCGCVPRAAHSAEGNAPAI